MKTGMNNMSARRKGKPSVRPASVRPLFAGICNRVGNQIPQRLGGKESYRRADLSPPT